MTIDALSGLDLSRYNEDELRIPHWDLADRMTKALRLSGLGVSEMAEAFGVSRQSVGRWLSGRVKPSRSTIYLWAASTGVDQEWLETGEASPEAVRLHELRCACRDSNPKPSDMESWLAPVVALPVNGTLTLNRLAASA